MTTNAEKGYNITEIGDNVSNFIKGDQKVEKSVNIKKNAEILKNKKYINVVLEIRANCGGNPLTRLEDGFVLKAEYDLRGDNTKVLANKLENIKNQVQRLVEIWTSEVEK